MKKAAIINKFSHEERIVNEKLLTSFTHVFASHDVYNFGLIFHDKGIFFEKMSKTRVESYFFALYFQPNGIGDYYDIEVERAISTDHLPGEVVLKFNCAQFRTEREENLGIMPEKKVFYFAFTFKDELIYSIRVPKSIVTELEFHRQNN
jgi:hypothetical protein